MAQGKDGYAARFAAELRALYVAAGSPRYAVVCHQAKAQRPPARVGTSTLSSWLKGDNVPADLRAVHFLTEYLASAARRRDPSFTMQPQGWWDALHKVAVDEKRAGRGRGGRPASTAGAAVRLGEAAGFLVSGPQGGTEQFRTRYSHQVRQIFSGELLDRDAELAELSEFATSSDGCPYVWWQGEAWTGKSALMASFVLNPPRGVRVVSFFVTARFAGQSDRAAFLEAVLGQLSGLLGCPVPDGPTESDQRLWFLELLEQAAQRGVSDGYRLVLVVDGLDEDRGTPVEGNVHSIAALLPGNPPAGVRIIVASRPVQSAPGDVPAWHPLNDAMIVRSLSQSAHAVVMRGDTQRDLARLLDGGGLGRHLLGLIVAAGGGLSGEDMAELVDEPVGAIEKILHTVAGRAFSTRDRRWGSSPERVFILAHEELYHAALRSLRSAELARWREAIHTWAEIYRDRGWPADTPEYLLRGYFELLRTEDKTRQIIACATDGARHDRMLDFSGGDSTALSEISLARERLLVADEPDLVAMTRIALHHRAIADRNIAIPVDLPTVVAKLGNPERAEALTRGIADPEVKAHALAGLARVAAGRGEPRRAREFANQVEYLVRTASDAYGHSVVSVAASEAAAAAGDMERARSSAESISSPYWRSIAIAAAVRAAADAGYRGQARLIADLISNPIHDGIPRALAAIEESEAMLTRLGRGSIWKRRYVIISNIGSPGSDERVVAGCAMAAASVGDTPKARELINAMLEFSRGHESPVARAMAAEVLAAVGDHERSVELASLAETTGEVNAYSDKVKLYVLLAKSAKILGNMSRAKKFVWQAAAVAREFKSATHDGWLEIDAIRAAMRAAELATVAELAVDLSELGLAEDLALRAEACARFAAVPSYEPSILALLTSAVQKIDARSAKQVALLVESAAEIEEPEIRGHALVAAAQSAATVGAGERVEIIASKEQRPRDIARILCAAAKAGIEVGHQEMADRLIGKAEETIRGSSKNSDAQALFALTDAVSKTGDVERTDMAFSRCEEASWLVSAPDSRAFIFADMTKLAAELGDTRRAREFARAAEQAAVAISDQRRKWELLRVVAQATAAAGNTDHAENLAGLIEDKTSYDFCRAMESAALVAAKNGNPERARSIALSIPNPALCVGALAAAAEAVASYRDGLDQARALAAEAHGMVHELTMSHRALGEDNIHDRLFSPMRYSTFQAESVLVTVAGALSAVGSLVDAEASIRKISDPRSICRALARMCTHVDSRQARRLLARAISLGYWELFINEIGKVEPLALLAIADHICEQHARNSPESDRDAAGVCDQPHKNS